METFFHCNSVNGRKQHIVGLRTGGNNQPALHAVGSSPSASGWWIFGLFQLAPGNVSAESEDSYLQFRASNACHNTLMQQLLAITSNADGGFR